MHYGQRLKKIIQPYQLKGLLEVLSIQKPGNCTLTDGKKDLRSQIVNKRPPDHSCKRISDLQSLLHY